MSKRLKLYLIDRGWRGAIIVASDSKENAKNLIDNYPSLGYPISNVKLEHIYEYKIENGLVIETAGDT